MDGCIFCDREFLRRAADVYLENEHCVYASTRDPRDPPDVLPGSGVIVPIGHKASPFDFSDEEWAATHDLLLQAKAVWDERLAPDGYGLYWSPSRRATTESSGCTRTSTSCPDSTTSPAPKPAAGLRSRAPRIAAPIHSPPAPAAPAVSGAGRARALSGPCRP